MSSAWFASCSEQDIAQPGPCQPVSGWGGVFQNLGPLPFQGPPKKIFRKAKIGGGEGGGVEVDVIFWKTKVPEIFRKTTFFKKFPKFSAKKSSFLKNFAIPACQSPLPASWAPFFTFFGGGGVTPPHPPRWHGPVLSCCKTKIVNQQKQVQRWQLTY